VPAGKASLFIVTGLVVGLLVGAGGTAGFVAVNSLAVRSTWGGQASNPSAPLTGGGSTGASGSPGPVASATVAVSGIVSSSLRQAGDVNVKLAEASIALRDQLDASQFDPEEAATILRSIASNAQFGSEVAPRIGMWPAAGDLSLDLAAFYESVRESARTGLGISLTSTSGYRQAAGDMIRTIRPVKGLQAKATTLGATANVQLPALPARTP
jgi:hypothetical protein